MKSEVRRQRVTLGRLLGSGGSSVVYEIAEAPEFVAKLYIDTNDPSRLNDRFATSQRSRIDAMLRRAPTGVVPHKVAGKTFPQLAWPVAHLSTDEGTALGFAMPHLPVAQACDLEALLSQKSRRLDSLPDDYIFRVHVARNLASMLRELHREGHYVVDLKPKNVKVYKIEGAMGLIAILDADGFSIQDSTGVRFPAQLASSEYTAPELFQPGSGPTSAGEAQDRWALAVIIFRLLNENFHPYQGKYLGSGSNAIDDHVQNNRFAYSLVSCNDLLPAPFSIHEFFNDDTRNLFERAFGPSATARPSSREWRDHLSLFDSDSGVLVQCNANRTHWHFSKGCGLCWREKIIAARTIQKAFLPPKPVPSVLAPPPLAPLPPPPPLRKKQGGVQRLIIVLVAAMTVFFLFRIAGKTVPPSAKLSEKVIPSTSTKPTESPFTKLVQSVRPGITRVLDLAIKSDTDDKTLLNSIDSEFANVSIPEYKDTSGSSQTDWKILHKEAYAYFKSSDFKSAIESERRALALAPDNYEVAADLAFFLLAQEPEQQQLTEARELALYSIGLQWARHKHGRPYDWQNLGIAEGLMSNTSAGGGALWVSLAVLPASVAVSGRAKRCENVVNETYGRHREKVRSTTLTFLELYRTRFSMSALAGCNLPQEILTAMREDIQVQDYPTTDQKSATTPPEKIPAGPTQPPQPFELPNATPGQVPRQAGSAPSNSQPTIEVPMPPSLISFEEALMQMREKITSEFRSLYVPLPFGVVVKVKLSLNSSGHIGEITIIMPSGNSAFDDAIVKSIKSAQPFVIPSGTRSLRGFENLEMVFRNEESNAPMAPAPPSTNPSDVAQAYHEVLHEGDAARRDKLLNFLQHYPGSIYEKDAMYSLGMVLTKLGKRSAALQWFEELIRRYPNSPYVPKALLEIGHVQRVMGDHGSARDSLNDLIKQFPQSDEATKAKVELVQFH